MKKLIALLMAVMMLLCCVACGGGNDTPNTPSDTPDLGVNLAQNREGGDGNREIAAGPG